MGTQDCSLGPVGKEGPHLTMTGASHVFSRAEVPVWGFHEVGRGDFRSFLSFLAGKSRSQNLGR